MPSLSVTCPNPDCQAALRLGAPPPAGKKLRCPRCGTAFTPPGEAGADAGTIALAPEGEKRCPSCKAVMAPEAILCVACGFNVKTGAKLEAPKKASKKKRKRAPREGPVTAADLPLLLDEAGKLIDLARKEVSRLPHVLGLGDDRDLAGLRHKGRTGRCANPNCNMTVQNEGLLGTGPREGTSVVTFYAAGKQMVLDLCPSCTEIILDDLATRDKIVLGYLEEAKQDLERAADDFPDNEEIKQALKEVRKVGLLAGAEKPKRRLCFVATAAFGSPSAAEVNTLRRYRDEVLQRSAAGRCFTRAYDLLSPPLAALIAASPRSCALARRLLRPLVAWCAYQLRRR
jgi:hypothetical protein